ncbi:MAG: SufD family Fe-S cluster assembly protein [Clostridia bacterium]|nr:SufD family Fe-S cluster assembly protein [Clostridia bacterium]
MNKTDEMLLENILEDKPILEADAYNIRKNGESIDRKVNEYISIISKQDNSGIDIYVKEGTPFGIINIPVIITESGLKDVVYNDFHIGKGAKVVIIAGCGIHNDEHKLSEHDGIHRFYIAENASVKYIEKHYADGKGKGKKVLNPVTEIYMESNSSMVMDTVQIKGVDESLRITKAKLKDKANLVVTEKILTDGEQTAKTVFEVKLDGEDAKAKLTSRSVAIENSYQEFKSEVIGNTKCFAHVECDAIIKDEGKVKAIPEIQANTVNANLIHEATIGKIAGEQLTKLMTLGLNEKEAENTIIKGFLR